MWKTRILAILLFIAGAALGWVVWTSEQEGRFLPQFKLGLDLQGGTQLVYRADVSGLPESQVRDSMEAARDVIERRVNLFGIAEPNVQVQDAGFGTGGEHRIIVDLPGVTEVAEAIEMIGQTPLLEFRVENSTAAPVEITVGDDGVATIPELDFSSQYAPTALTGRYLDRALLQFDQTTRQPIIALEFDQEGAVLFETLTRENIGKSIAIFLDGQPISIPTVNEAITGGQAVITGDFTPQEARELVGRLNSGALPVPVELIATQTIGASLGGAAVARGVQAGIFGFFAVVLFLIAWYRLPGLLAVLALTCYALIMFTLIKVIPITLTAPGIAGFIISLGTAVDANILIFERMKEELRSGALIPDAIKNGFSRAWLSIRDANTSSIITGIILFSVGTTLMQGFAFMLVMGMIVSLFSAMTISRVFLLAAQMNTTRITQFLFGSGFFNSR